MTVITLFASQNAKYSDSVILCGYEINLSLRMKNINYKAFWKYLDLGGLK
jgi:hypothetical protein